MKKSDLEQFTSWLGKRSYKARLKRLGLERLQEIARENGEAARSKLRKTTNILPVFPPMYKDPKTGEHTKAAVWSRARRFASIRTWE